MGMFTAIVIVAIIVGGVVAGVKIITDAVAKDGEGKRAEAASNQERRGR